MSEWMAWLDRVALAPGLDILVALLFGGVCGFVLRGWWDRRGLRRSVRDHLRALVREDAIAHDRVLRLARQVREPD